MQCETRNLTGEARPVYEDDREVRHERAALSIWDAREPLEVTDGAGHH
jgi:hypothetical protein